MLWENYTELNIIFSSFGDVLGLSRIAELRVYCQVMWVGAPG